MKSLNSVRRIFLLCTVSLLGLSVAACNEAKSDPKALVPVRLAPVEKITVGNGVRYSADIVPYSQVDLAFKSNGYVDSVLQVKGTGGRRRNVDQGDWVQKGTVLALVHQQDYQDKLEQAKAQLSRAQAEFDKAKLSFDRTSALYKSQSATKPEYDSAQAQLDSTAASVAAAKAQISEAQVALAYCSLEAPFDGWIVKRSVDVGSLVGPATNGFTIADTRSVKAEFGVPDTAINRVRVGQLLAVTTDALPGEFRGHVTNISPAADPKSRVYSVSVTIENPGNRLKAGMIASIALGDEKLPHPVTAVPLAAVVHDPNEQHAFAVMVADANGDTATAQLRRVGVGDAYGNMIEVTSGLSEGEKVVATGATLIKNGDQVRIIP
ncbi:MAG TPA: efflux RND transporter periplasmic adaptor subunit [Terriglobales bacterium]|nr:efflux RND transporter periplasmic adaptor subunit [Terriglobales bacterium]